MEMCINTLGASVGWLVGTCPSGFFIIVIIIIVGNAVVFLIVCID